jgi:hypothetical protein
MQCGLVYQLPCAPEQQAVTRYHETTVTEQLRLSERDPSPSYTYLREVRRRMEVITWEEAGATMAPYGSPEQCVQKLRNAHRPCGGGSGDLLV